MERTHQVGMASSQSEVQCLYCELTFGSENAERRHVQESHAEEAYLHCPGCDETGFKVPSELMGHIERGQCTALSIASINTRRQRKLARRRHLNPHMSARQNYSRFINKRAPVAGILEEPGSSRDFDSPSVLSTLPSTASDTASLASRAASVASVRSDGTRNSNMLPVRDRQASSSVGEDFFGFREQHDNDIGSDIPRNEFSGKFHCPKDRCRQTFKNRGGLVAHLRSSAHSSVRYTCPKCYKQLHSLQGMTAHAEDTRSRCSITSSDIFATYMEQLTGGLVQVEFVGEKSRVKFKNSKIEEADLDAPVVSFPGH